MTTRTMSPAELHAELHAQASLARERRAHAGTAPHSTRSTRRARTRRAFGLLAALTLAAGATAAWATHGGSTIDLTVSGTILSHNTAVFTQGGVGAGTGNFDPYLTLSPGGNADTESGYNFCDEAGCPDNQFDELEGGDRTHELLASAIPVTTYNGTLYRQFFLDSNDSGSDPFMSIEVIKLFLDNQKNLTDYDVVLETFGNDSGTTASKIWDLDGAGDQTILMNTQGLESGSGVSDISVLVPDSLFPSTCSYGSTTCTQYVIFYTEAGGAGIIGDRNYNTTAGFEEWRIELRPVVNVSKTANVSLTRTYPWSLLKTADVETINLFAGQSASINWTVTATVGTPVDSNTTVSGTISLFNPSGGAVIQDAIPAEVANVTDVLSQAGLNTSLTVTCPQAYPFTIPAQGTVQCTYTGTPPNTTNGTNTATATLNLKNKQGQIVSTTSYSGTAAVNFAAATVAAVDECIIVTDDNATPGNIGDDTTLDSNLCFNESPGVYQFSTTVGPFTVPNCTSTTVTNTAHFETVDDANDTTQNGNASDSVNVNCYTLGVSKTADESLTRTYPWTIAKEADGEPDHIDLFAGQSATINWTITAQVGTPVDSGHLVTGTITVSNPAPMIASGVSVADVVSSGLAATVDCDPATAGNQTTVNVPAKSGATNGTATCSYTRALPNGDTRTNTATATLAGIGYTGTAEVNFTGATTALVDECIEVKDDNATPSVPGDDVTLDASLCYNETMPGSYPLSTTVGPFTTETCGNTTVTNTARFETVDDANDTTANGSDDDSVTVSCFELGVTKNATTEFTRDYNWNVVKTRVLATGETDGDGDLTTLTLDEGQTFTLTYNITVSVSGSTDSGWKVSGTISIQNPAPIAANGVSVTDAMTGGITGIVDCDPITIGDQATLNIAASSTGTCAYRADLPNATSRTNTATATFAGVNYTNTASVTFGTTPTTQIDECVVVKDDMGTTTTSDDVTLDASLCVNEAPHTYTHTISVGPFATCGPQQLVNTANIITVDDSNDTGETHSSTYTVNIDVPCPQGCTLTQGYWRTHNDSFHGGAPTDPTWELIGPLAENEIFFLSNQTYFQVMWTAPKGNVYYNLAHQYIAAQLNMLDGADGSAITTAFSQATTLFQTYTPAQIAALKGKNGNALRAQFISLAGTLASYNEGLIGPGHCDEDASSTAGGGLITFASATVPAHIDRHRMA